MSTPKIGHYELQREIGRGGMAVVYLARDPDHNRAVAIKMLPREFMYDPKFIARFKRETKVISSLKSPGMVPIYDFGEHDGQPFMVMKYMSGGSLKQHIGGKTVGLGEAASIISQISPVLDEAHGRGLIHRDIKPDNILFDEENRAFLADFGIVKMTESQSIALTTQGGVLGTPAFMSPEQVVGKDKLDGRSDVYALGVILFQLLTGRVPYQADTPMSQAMMHVLEPMPNILEVRSDLPRGTQLIVEKAMAKDRDDRYPSATALAKAVGDLAASAGATLPIVAPVEANRRKMPTGLLLGSLFAFLCLVFSAGAFFVVTSGQDDEPTSAPSLIPAATEQDFTNEPAVTAGIAATAALILPGGSTADGSTGVDSAGSDGLLPTLRATITAIGPTPEGTRTIRPTSRPSATAQSTPQPPNSPPTDAPQGPTNTPPPPATSTQPPLPTNTQSSPPTNTPVPPPINTQPPTNTPVPPPTITPQPPPTNTPLPPPTNTPLPPPTITPQPPTAEPPTPTKPS